ncbi:(2Fe-2S)-binding protein [Streptomyces sp. NPDC059740]|uniref:(2Fe-2S)-binding protein n=1 Tax=Streptomyces sp. NPDC059740 TaxID=3346926 RepID=UPI0036667D1F
MPAAVLSSPAVRRRATATPASPSAPTTSPLAAAYARLAEVFPGLRLAQMARAPQGEGWVTGASLAAGGPALEDFVAVDAAQALADHGRPARPDVAATFALHRYAWPAALAVTLPWFLLRRVPRTSPQHVSFHRGSGRLAVTAKEFACLPDDEAAGLPGAVVVRDEEALRAEVRSAVATQLEPVLAAFRPLLRRGPRGLWAMVTDEIVEGLWYTGHLLGEEARAKAELARLLPGTVQPFVGGPAFRTLTGPDGAALPTRDRASCCMYYTMRPEDTCITCPRTCDEERVARLTGAA